MKISAAPGSIRRAPTLVPSARPRMDGTGGSPRVVVRTAQRYGRESLSSSAFSTDLALADNGTQYPVGDGRDASKGGHRRAARRDPRAAEAARGLPLT